MKNNLRKSKIKSVMKSRINSAGAKFLLLAAAFFFFAAAGSYEAFGQKFKPGEAVECDPVGTGDYMKGTVVEYLPKDNPTFQGDYYLTRVVIDKWSNTYPEGVLCQTKQVRARQNVAVTPTNQTNGANTKNEPPAAATELAAKFNPGDRVECDTMNIGKFFKGTVLPFQPKDNPDLDKDKSGKYFYIHRVRMDNEASTRPEGGMCFTDRTRLLTGANAAPMEIPKTEIPIGAVTVDADNTLSADRPILECPVAQTPVKNGARPNAELLKKITRCDKGEKAASKGLDGAVTVDVTAIQIAAPRQWIYSRDIGGKPGTTIYPVRVTYTVKTFYRQRTLVAENWVRTINFYVNEFGEWQSGSEEPVKSPATKDVPRL